MERCRARSFCFADAPESSISLLLLTLMLLHRCVIWQRLRKSPTCCGRCSSMPSKQGECDWIHWGDDESKFSNWTNHSNRLIPVYTFGLSLENVGGEKSCYRSEERLSKIYGQVPSETFCIDAQYLDQTEIFDLQMEAIAKGKKHVILFVCDGMDWQTTQAAAIYKNGKVPYTKGRGTGLRFLDYTGGDSEFGFMVTSPHNGGTEYDVDAQTITNDGGNRRGGYRQARGGKFPWSVPSDPGYLNRAKFEFG